MVVCLILLSHRELCNRSGCWVWSFLQLREQLHSWMERGKVGSNFCHTWEQEGSSSRKDSQALQQQSRLSSCDWFPSTSSPRPVPNWSCFLGFWTATHVFLWQMWCDLHLNLIMAFVLPPFCPIWTIEEVLSRAMEGCTWASPPIPFAETLSYWLTWVRIIKVTKAGV